MRSTEDRVMLFLLTLSGALLLAALLASPSGVLSDNMILPGANRACDAAQSGSPLASALDMISKGNPGPYAGTRLRDHKAVGAVYAARRYVPLWYSGERLTPGAEYLLSVFDDAEAHGLNPANYHTNTSLRGSEGKIARELLLTDAFVAYARDLGAGRLQPGVVYSKWEPTDSRHTAASIATDLVAFLKGTPWPGGSLSPGTLAQVLLNFQPSHNHYNGLKKSLAKHQTIVKNGGWPAVPPGSNLIPGDTGSRIVVLRQRLVLSGDFQGKENSPKDFYDQELKDAVLRFQRRCGLPASGIIGHSTLAALNVSATERVQCITWNMERLRWLSREMGARNVQVNIPAFSLEMWDSAGMVGEMAVVVGRVGRPTPVMSEDLTTMVLNPFWNVPAKLALYDILPAVMRDSTYLATRGIRVYSGWSYGEEEINPTEVCWQDVDPLDFPFHFRQDPGPRNALGRIKFLFPNRYAVYLHDTNQKNGFRHSNRAISSGCVRVENPQKLADFLMADKSNREHFSYSAMLSSGETMSVSLESPARIHLMYMTAFVDENGVINFRPDIYNYDKTMTRLMDQYVKGLRSFPHDINVGTS